MPTVISEGLEMDTDKIPERSGRIVKVGPLSIPIEVRDAMEDIAVEESRSVCNVARVLIEYGLRYREEKRGRFSNPRPE